MGLHGGPFGGINSVAVVNGVAGGLEAGGKNLAGIEGERIGGGGTGGIGSEKFDEFSAVVVLDLRDARGGGALGSAARAWAVSQALMVSALWCSSRS